MNQFRTKILCHFQASVEDGEGKITFHDGKWTTELDANDVEGKHIKDLACQIVE